MDWNEGGGGWEEGEGVACPLSQFLQSSLGESSGFAHECSFLAVRILEIIIKKLGPTKNELPSSNITTVYTRLGS